VTEGTSHDQGTPRTLGRCGNGRGVARRGAQQWGWIVAFVS
jgi:hypothetical protein